MKLFVKFRPVLSFGLGLGAVCGLMLLANCGSDDGPSVPVVDPLVGEYSFVSSTFMEDVTITLVDTVTYPDSAVFFDQVFPTGAPADAFVLNGLFDTAPTCDDASVGIALEEDGDSKLVCITTGAKTDQGTWAFDATTNELTLVVVPPASPIILPVVIENVVFAGTQFTGLVSNFPLPKNVAFSLGAPLPDGSANLQSVMIQVTFNKENSNTGN